MSGPVVVTGARGFIGKNLMPRLCERGFDVRTVAHDAGAADLRSALQGAKLVFHLAGVNRPIEETEYASGNAEFTRTVCDALAAAGQGTPIVYASSIQAERDNPYGASKRDAESAIARYAQATGARAFVFRLPNVFGKWCRPNYNSAVATFCHNIARGIPVKVSDPATRVQLVYVDDVIDHFVGIADDPSRPDTCTVRPVYEIALGDLVRELEGFRDSRSTLMAGRVGAGFSRALHATYMSYLPPELFAYPLVSHADPRGTFVEMLRTPESGQISYFTAHPGVTRGGHYHHTKTEKFLIVEGKARFRFRNVITGESFEILTSGDVPQIVETVPGWAHDVTNIGDGKMIAVLWANEVFDKNRPDTLPAQL